MRLKKNSQARALGAERANRARTAWEEQAIAIYVQLLHERPHLTPKERRYEVTEWMNRNSTHPKRITDAMMLAALRRPETKSTLAALKEMFETSATSVTFSEEEDQEIWAAAAEITRFIDARYAQAFGSFVEATAVFRAACIEASKTDDFDSEVQRAVQVVRNKPPARVRTASADK